MRPLSRRLLLVLLALSSLFPPSGSGQQGTAYATTTLRMRSAPSADAPSVGTIPRARAVAVGRCSAGWCSVRFGGAEGYVSQRFLGHRRTQAPAGGEGRGYVNSRGERVPSPRRSVDGSVPSGASARCRDGTYSFSRSRRGTCSHHGGVETWL